MPTIPTTVKHDDLQAALKPLYELLGVDRTAVMRSPGIFLQGDEIRFLVAANFRATDPGERPAAAKARESGDIPGHPQGSTDPFNSLPVSVGYGDKREYAYDVAVRVVG